jgi:arsenate reductase
MLTLFGIANCDTVKKAQRWLEQHAINYQFHDFRRDGLDTAVIQKWLKQVDWTDLLNQRSRTWRELDADQKENLTKDMAVKLMIDQPTLIKRPVVITKDVFIIGFSPDQYQSQLT